jgi:hypothetical protein
MNKSRFAYDFTLSATEGNAQAQVGFVHCLLNGLILHSSIERLFWLFTATRCDVA